MPICNGVTAAGPPLAIGMCGVLLASVAVKSVVEILLLPPTTNPPVIVVTASVDAPPTLRFPPANKLPLIPTPPTTCNAPVLVLVDATVLLIKVVPVTARDPAPVRFKDPEIIVFCNVVCPDTFNALSIMYLNITTPEPPLPPSVLLKSEYTPPPPPPPPPRFAVPSPPL